MQTGAKISYLLHAEPLFMHVTEVEHGLCIVLLIRRHPIMHSSRLVVHLCAVAIVVVVSYLHSCYSVACTHIKVQQLFLTRTRAALSDSARRYDLAVCCSKMSRDIFLSERFMKQIKRLKRSLEKFAAVMRECACLQGGGESKQ